MKNYCLLLLLFVTQLAPVAAQGCNNYPCVIAKVKKALQAKNFTNALDNLESADGYPDKNAAEIQKMRRQIFSAIEREKESAQKAYQDLVKANAEKIRYRLNLAYRDRMLMKFDAAFDNIVEAGNLGANLYDIDTAYQNLTRSSLNSARQNMELGEYKLASDNLTSAVKSAAKIDNRILFDSVSLTRHVLWNTVFDKTRGALLNTDYGAAFRTVNSVFGLKDSLETTLGLYHEIAYCYTETGRLDSAGVIFEDIASIRDNKNVADMLKARAGRKADLQEQILRKASLLLDPTLHARLSARYFPGEFANIPGGKFNMGHDDPEGRGICPVTVNAFSICPKEVTFYEYDIFCAATRRHKPEDNNWGRGSRPVVDVSWNDAVAYCNWRSRREGLLVVYHGDTCNRSANGYRLPSEAEWEYAAGNGAKHTQYSWGNDLPHTGREGNAPDRTLRDSFPGWETFSGYSDGFAYTAPVGYFAPNDFGLCDMSGNVWEWCWDNPVGNDCPGDKKEKGAPTPAPAFARALRGGSWGSFPGDCRVSNRFYADPAKRNFSTGFRLAKNVEIK